MEEQIIAKNKQYWDDHADLWFGTTALPQYGVRFVTEDDLHFFDDVEGKKVLELCCGSGHSLRYLAQRGAGELWGLDLSRKQLDNAENLLAESGCNSRLICAPMEAESDIPKEYFDYVFSIYGIGWTTDLEGTLKRIASYLKKDGIFIFSWGHPLHYCVGKSYETGEDVVDNGALVFSRSYFDESYLKMPVHDTTVTFANRKISTYVNALYEAGFIIEKMVEQTDDQSLSDTEDNSAKAQKARMVPLSMCFKCRKLW
ncbi:MAG: class I SAM-dependent methyltransferase [Clostridiales bacterium]|nr:class I SAM-dependent methyltransferase [Clostridiales bacterium]